MATAEKPCPKCGWRRYSTHYHPAVRRVRFLWWDVVKAKPECIMLWCLGCSYKWERPDLLGTTLSRGD